MEFIKKKLDLFGERGVAAVCVLCVCVDDLLVSVDEIFVENVVFE